MAECEVCGNDHAETFEIRTIGGVHNFDSFECAAQKLAPFCANCKRRTVGRGIQTEEQFFCCTHCLEMKEQADDAQPLP